MIILLIRILYLLMLHYLYFLLFLAISRAQTIIKSMSELNTIQGDEISLTFNLKFSSLSNISDIITTISNCGNLESLKMYLIR